ncbi:uncharacterized protein YdaL [Streptosporangium becharense]|uniref:Uncharacterized protein YdaL n=1 Tax=Streptosporangium becharense TaxID=1816182 RepID=A0A7W9IN46_9ACTN|nr:DUF2334 domain-containing protein [Streptosporangium becharense]MBB2914541.1 uncharacterized protein YdaL [Streptosporangium becharense]MBB5823386.1 uncharacterized protein YdaL [Streptosporangium becharense]
MSPLDHPPQAPGGRHRVGLRWLAALALSGTVVFGANLVTLTREAEVSLPAPRSWPGCAAGAPAPPAATTGPARATTLILADDAGDPPLSRVRSILAANLASHFGPVRTMGTSDYRAGMLRRHRALVYLGASTGQRLPAALRRDILAGGGRVLWMGGDIDRLTTRERFEARYGWRWGGPSDAGIRGVRYKGTLLSRSPLEEPVHAFAAVDRRRVKVLGEVVTGDGRTWPWAVRSGNLTYVGEVPLNSLADDDRYLAAADLLFDLLAPATPVRRRALVRLEDIGPQADPHALRAAGELLSRKGVPFSFGVIPVYRGPLPDGTARPEIRLKDRPEVVRAITYLLEHGGTMVLHGYTHQSDGPANPENGESGHDFEFFRTHFGPGRELVYDGPIRGDSATWMNRRLDAAAAELRAAHLPVPRIFEPPHYAASPVDYRVIARRFAARYDRGAYFSPGWEGSSPASPHMYEQSAPYLIRDVYGSVVIPENLGMVQLRPSDPSQGTVESIVAHARSQLVVRDNVASFFYHPFLGTKPLESIVDQMRGLGYRFVSPCDL